MSDANTGQTVECPICETSFDPTVAGGWCTNTDCGEWQYTDDAGGDVAEPDVGADDSAEDDEVEPAEPDAPLTECPGCDSEVDPEDNFCVNCGENLRPHRDGETDVATATDTLEPVETPPVPDSLVLEVAGREVAVDDGDTVGREIRAALADAGRPEDEAVRIHREHVRFVREDDSFYLLDLGANPTELNGKSLQKGDREPVEPGDEIELSGVVTVTVRGR